MQENIPNSEPTCMPALNPDAVLPLIQHCWRGTLCREPTNTGIVDGGIYTLCVYLSNLKCGKWCNHHKLYTSLLATLTQVPGARITTRDSHTCMFAVTDACKLNVQKHRFCATKVGLCVVPRQHWTKAKNAKSEHCRKNVANMLLTTCKMQNRITNANGDDSVNALIMRFQCQLHTLNAPHAHEQNQLPVI